MIKIIMYAAFILYFGISPKGLICQQIKADSELSRINWSACWISCPDVPRREYGVYHFRKTFTLAEKPVKFLIHVTADNRYRLFVNGLPVCLGPARGDLYNWYFETIDIAAYLHAGNNSIAALVWNMGLYAPVAQISNQTGFLLQGDNDIAKEVNTGENWKVVKDYSYSLCSTDNGPRLHAYMVTGPGDCIVGSSHLWGWEKTDFDDRNWSNAECIAAALNFGTGTDNLWTLVPRNIPLSEEKYQTISTVRRVEGLNIPAEIFTGKSTLSIPENKKVTILLDQKFNTTAYPELTVSGGKGSSVKLTYAETLFRDGQKGNRNEIDGKEIIGNYDIFMPDGGMKRMFRPLWFRTYRYLQLDIETKSEPLVIDDLHGMYTGYPFKMTASFESNDSTLKKIWETGWRTARLCAGETYFDCPYYEQLQYEGDTRIQALISLYATGDDRLMRKALLDFWHSFVPEGLTQGRYPSSRLQVIPPYSLAWISMIYDYWMLRKDDAFISQFLPGINSILSWYEKNIDKNKMMLGPMRWWNFVDYSDCFPNGVPDGANDGNSSVVTLLFTSALQQSSALYDYFGKKCEAGQYKELANELSQNTYKLCYNKDKQEMANTPEQKAYSQHAGILAILSGAIPERSTKEVMNKIITDTTLGPATFYFRFYLMQALKKAGMGDMYYSQLKPWRDMLNIGLTTFAEKPEPARSDCHAWSASPVYDFLATLCGITPDEPGFASVCISPAMGELKHVAGEISIPAGQITVDITRKGGIGVKADIALPDGIPGRFVWNGKEVKLKSGKQQINME